MRRDRMPRSAQHPHSRTHVLPNRTAISRDVSRFKQANALRWLPMHRQTHLWTGRCPWLGVHGLARTGSATQVEMNFIPFRNPANPQKTLKSVAAFRDGSTIRTRSKGISRREWKMAVRSALNRVMPSGPPSGETGVASLRSMHRKLTL